MKGTIDNCSVFGYCGDSDGAATLTGKCCAYNFLNNGYFLNPVNQRNFGSDAGLPDKPIYTIDRWVACTESGYAEVQVLPDGVQVRPLETDAVEFQQRFAKNTLKYVTYTAAFCDTDGNITLVKDALTYLPTKPYDIVSIRVTKPTKFVWAAMYEGDYTIDTLPPYVQKGYDVELAECRRYYRRFPKSATASYSGYAFNDTTARITLEGVGGMRIPPTVRFLRILAQLIPTFIPALI